MATHIDNNDVVPTELCRILMRVTESEPTSYILGGILAPLRNYGSVDAMWLRGMLDAMWCSLDVTVEEMGMTRERFASVMSDALVG